MYTQDVESTLEAPGEISLNRGAVGRRGRALLWLLAGVVLLSWLGTPPVRRTQEARVLETARQMLGAGLQGWMLPYLNGVPRLQKPPLAYWMAAGAYKVGGVNEWSGRVPFAFLTWLTVGLTYAAGRRLLGSETAGLIASATLFGSLLFFRNGRLAETDGPSMCFVTLAVYSFWRAASERRLGWWHVGAIGVGGAVMAKGPPGAYPILFLLILPFLVERRWRVLLDFLRSGALLTIALIAAPWFAYVRFSGHWAIVGKELDIVIGGEDHARPAYNYIPALLAALVPWSAASIAAIVGAIARAWRGDVALRTLLAWAGAVFVPLLLIGQKQNHYLMPALPPLALVLGWAATQPATSPGVGRAVRTLLIVTLATGILAVVAVPVTGYVVRKHLIAGDVVLAGLMLVGLVIVTLVARRRGVAPAIVAGALGGAALLAYGDARWLQTVAPDDARAAAAYMKEHVGPGPYCFYGANISLPLCFDLRASIPFYRTPEELAAARTAAPGLVVISVTKPERTPDPPPGMTQIGERVDVGERSYKFYRAAP